MDFIVELSLSNGFDYILVIVDKLTKFVTLIPTTMGVNKEQTAKIFFVHIFSKYGLLRQIITDRDSHWTGTFWKEVTKRFKIQRAITTAHCPQDDGQTKIMNKVLETALRSGES